MPQSKTLTPAELERVLAYIGSCGSTSLPAMDSNARLGVRPCRRFYEGFLSSNPPNGLHVCELFVIFNLSFVSRMNNRINCEIDK